VAEWHDTTEEYLEAILEIEEEGTIPIRARLVERLGLSAPAVSETVNRLIRGGYANLNEDHYDGDGEINLRWTASTDDTDPQAFIRYDVFVNGVLSDIAVGRTRSIVYGVGGTNIIEVVAKDSAGNVSTPATVTVVLNL